MLAINNINIDLVNPVAENSSPVDVTVVVEGTVRPPTPPTNITATAVASTSRKTITEVGLSLIEGVVQQLRVTLTSPIEDVAPYKATFTGQVVDIEIPITIQPEPSSGYRGQKTGTLVVWSISHRAE